jgi:hypothetical protein
MVLTAYIVLSPATNSSCHRRRRIEGFAEPGWARKTSADLTPATGARTTRFCRTLQSPFVCAPQIAHEVQPALRLPLRARRCRVHRIPPRVRDDRDTPLSWGETAGDIDLIWVRREGKYFCKQGWTTQIRLIWFNNLRLRRAWQSARRKPLRSCSLNSPVAIGP